MSYFVRQNGRVVNGFSYATKRELFADVGIKIIRHEPVGNFLWIRNVFPHLCRRRVDRNFLFDDFNKSDST